MKAFWFIYTTMGTSVLYQELYLTNSHFPRKDAYVLITEAFRTQIVFNFRNPGPAQTIDNDMVLGQGKYSSDKITE